MSSSLDSIKMSSEHHHPSHDFEPFFLIFSQAIGRPDYKRARRRNDEVSAESGLDSAFSGFALLK